MIAHFARSLTSLTSLASQPSTFAAWDSHLYAIDTRNEGKDLESRKVSRSRRSDKFEMETDEVREQKRSAHNFKEGLRGMELRFLQDIPQDQRTQRHAMQIEYYNLAIKCVETMQMAPRVKSQGRPLNSATADLGDPVAFHALLARMYYLCQVCRRTLHSHPGTEIAINWGLM